jgi:hypothetical protein
MPVPGGYRMYYSAGVQYVYTKEEIAYATSADGIVWERDTVKNPVLPAGAEGTWDDTWVFAPRILYLDGRYHMWYGGTGEYWGIYCLGLATSSDGIAWERYGGNPVLVPSPRTWDGYKTLSGSVLLVGDSLYMWYDAAGATGTSQLWCIGLATCRFVPVSVRQDVIQTTEFSLLQNYPNPFNPSTTIAYELPKSSMVRLVVYDMLGREVAVLVNEEVAAGRHDVQFNASRLASGVYLCQLQAGVPVQTRKLLMVR